MTLVEQTYLGLHSVGLVNSREAFSTQYLGKNPNWYSYQTHMRRDFSVSAAVECQRRTKTAPVAGATVHHLADFGRSKSAPFFGM